MKIKDLSKLLPTLPQEASCSITLYDDGTPLRIGVPPDADTSTKNNPESAPKASTGVRSRSRAAKADKKPPADAPANPNVLSAADKKKRTKKAVDLIKNMNDTGGDETMAAQSIMDEFQASKKQADKIVADVSKKYKLLWIEESLPEFNSDDPMGDLKTI